jgi:hypothetical protein
MVESLGHPVTGVIQDATMDDWVNDYVVRDQDRQGVLRKMKGCLVAAGLMKWGDGVLTDLQNLASGAVDTRQRFLSDVGLLHLDKFLCFCVDPTPFCGLLVELTFSQLKQTRSNNEGSAMTNAKMWTRMQMLHPGREERRKMLRIDGDEHSHVEHLDTFRHLIAWVKGTRETRAVHTQEKMSATPAASVFHEQGTIIDPRGKRLALPPITIAAAFHPSFLIPFLLSSLTMHTHTAHSFMRP